MVVVNRHSSVPVGESSYCVLFTGETTSANEFFIPVIIDGEDGRAVHESLNGGVDNHFAMSSSVILGMLEQIDQSAVFMELDYDAKRSMFCTHLASYFSSEVGKKFYRLEIPLAYGIIMPLMTGEQLQIVVGNHVVTSVGRNMVELESFINKRKEHGKKTKSR
jgi:hypothetical protein